MKKNYSKFLLQFGIATVLSANALLQANEPQIASSDYNADVIANNTCTALLSNNSATDEPPATGNVGTNFFN